MNMSRIQKGRYLYYNRYYTSKVIAFEQNSRKLHEAVYTFIFTFPTNFHITKSRHSLNNTEILCGEQLKL